MINYGAQVLILLTLHDSMDSANRDVGSGMLVYPSGNLL